MQTRRQTALLFYGQHCCQKIVLPVVVVKEQSGRQMIESIQVSILQVQVAILPVQFRLADRT